MAGYLVCLLDGQLVAGLTHGAGDSPCWTTNVAVADVDRTADAVVAAGGQVTGGPGEFGDLGRRLADTDPAGTDVLMSQLRGADGVAPRPAAAGRWAATEPVGPTAQQIAALYRAVFGWTRDSDGTWRSAGAPVAASAPVPAGWPATRPSMWVTSFAVDGHQIAHLVNMVGVTGLEPAASLSRIMARSLSDLSDYRILLNAAVAYRRRRKSSRSELGGVSNAPKPKSPQIPCRPVRFRLDRTFCCDFGLTPRPGDEDGAAGWRPVPSAPSHPRPCSLTRRQLDKPGQSEFQRDNRYGGERLTVETDRV